MGENREAPVVLLSLCMIVKNESENLPKVLASVKDCVDELVVVDTGSTDNTPTIARSFGAKLIIDPWRDDFSYSRNISIKYATGSWILWLDADDVLPVASVGRINELKREKADKVFTMVINNKRPDGTGSNFLQARMFPRNPNIYFERAIHEQISLSALRAGLLLVPTGVVIEHHGYATDQELQKKAGRNVTMLLKEIQKCPKDPFLSIECADSYLIMKKDEEALDWYNRTLRIRNIERDFPLIASQAYFGMGSIHNKNNRYHDAVEALIKACSLCKERTDALFGLAVAYEMDNNKIEAIKTLWDIFPKPHIPLQISVDYALTGIKATLRLSRLLRETKDVSGLERLYAHALATWPQRPEILTCAGQIAFFLDRIIDSLHCFEKSVRTRPEGNIDGYIGLCMVYCKAGKSDVARDTVLSMARGFDQLARYWALRRIVGMNHPFDLPPDAEFDMDDVKKEVQNIQAIYCIKEII